MKELGKVSQDEMDKRFPDLMSALKADPDDVVYCGTCDGLRVKGHECIPLVPSTGNED